MEQARPSEPGRPFRLYDRRPVAGQWNFEEARMMNRAFERMRLLAKQADDPEIDHAIELAAGNLFTQLIAEVREDPDRAVDMITQLTASDDVDRDLAGELLSVYHYHLLDRNALEDPQREAARWGALIERETRRDEQEWLQEDVTNLIERIEVSGRADLRPFADALRAVVEGEDDS